MKNLRFIPALALILSALACGLPQSVPAPDQTTPEPDSVTPAPPTSEPPTLTPAIDTPALTFDQIANMDIYAPAYERTVTLNGGVFQSGADPSSMDYLSVVLQQTYAVGDFNADGADDIAVLIGENGGGTGVFVSLIVFLNQGGMPLQAATALIDDRPMIHSLGSVDGPIVFDGVIHGFNDPGCCPNFPVTETYRLDGDVLTLTSLASKTADGQARIVSIDAPLDGVSASGSAHLTGSVTIAPFENNLVYRIFDGMTNVELAAGPCMVSAPDLGAPGTFDIEIPLNISPTGGIIRIELQDENMADGSLLAMDSVTLNVP